MFISLYIFLDQTYGAVFSYGMVCTPTLQAHVRFPHHHHGDTE